MSSTEGIGLVEQEVLSELKGLSKEPCTVSSRSNLAVDSMVGKELIIA